MELALAAARFLTDGKGQNVLVLDVRGLTLIADFFVIASGSSQRHVKALADRVLEGLAGENHGASSERPAEGTKARWIPREPTHVEGYDSAYWILLDYGDVIVHVFRETERAFYGLERLWGDAPQVNMSPNVF